MLESVACSMQKFSMESCASLLGCHLESRVSSRNCSVQRGVAKHGKRKTMATCPWIVARNYREGSQWQAALIFLHRSHRLGIHNALQTYNWLLNGMKCDGHWSVGLALLQDATDRRLELNGITFSHLLQIWRKWGPWHKALVCLEELRTSKLRADAELLGSTCLAMERNHRLEESRNAIVSVKRRLCTELRDCHDSKLREAAVLDATWAGSGLPPDVFGILLSRRLGSPIATAVLQGKQPQLVSCNERLQNVHTCQCSVCSGMAEEKDPSIRASKFFEEEDEIKTPKEIFFWGLPWLKRIVTGYPFELFFVLLIVVNCGTMMAQIELIGGKLAYEVGLQTTPVNTMDEFFFYAELCFGIAFTFEICLKFVAFGILGFWKLTWNWMDLFVAGTSADERIETTPSADPELRQEIWRLFGNVGRGLVSMFELTLANYAGSLLAPWEVGTLFKELDADGSGALDKDEFKAALSDPRLRVWLSALDLQSSDAENLFNLLDDGDGSISYQEFLSGAKRLKGGAQSIDLVTLMRECGNQAATR
eukprot:Skav232472  [mRNA]  locus=scaffold2877:144742:155311:+ [translate_table: standard]